MKEYQILHELNDEAAQKKLICILINMFEIAKRNKITQTAICNAADINRSQLSRILAQGLNKKLESHIVIEMKIALEHCFSGEPFTSWQDKQFNELLQQLKAVSIDRVGLNFSYSKIENPAVNRAAFYKKKLTTKVFSGASNLPNESIIALSRKRKIQSNKIDDKSEQTEIITILNRIFEIAEENKITRQLICQAVGVNRTQLSATLNQNLEATQIRRHITTEMKIKFENLFSGTPFNSWCNKEFTHLLQQFKAIKIVRAYTESLDTFDDEYQINHVNNKAPVDEDELFSTIFAQSTTSPYILNIAECAEVYKIFYELLFVIQRREIEQNNSQNMPITNQPAYKQSIVADKRGFFAQSSLKENIPINLQTASTATSQLNNTTLPPASKRKS